MQKTVISQEISHRTCSVWVKNDVEYGSMQTGMRNQECISQVRLRIQKLQDKEQPSTNKMLGQRKWEQMQSFNEFTAEYQTKNSYCHHIPLLTHSQKAVPNNGVQTSKNC